MIITAQNCLANASLSNIGIQIDSKQSQIRIDLENKTKADLAYALPLQLIQPKSYRLIDGGPQTRREFIDWGIFNHNKQFLPDWRNFNKALQQRNALLKTRQPRELSAWDKEIVEYGEILNQHRKNYSHRLQPVFLAMAQQFLPLTDIAFNFIAGWDESLSLSETLTVNLEKDLRYGFTHNGPHRADFLISYKNQLAKDFLSRGQLKLLVLALLLAQVELLKQAHQITCCVLIDDLCAELDTVNRLKLLKYLSESGCQVFITATELTDFGDITNLDNYKMFHVEQGQIKQL